VLYPPTVRGGHAAWRVTLRQSLPLMASGVARATIFSFDVIVVSLELGPHDLGVYGIALRPVDFAAGAVGLFSLSFLSAFTATNPEDAAALHGRSLRVSVAACCALAFMLSLGSGGSPFVFGDEYVAAVPVLAILAWRIPFAALSGMYIAQVVARRRQWTLMWNAVAKCRLPSASTSLRSCSVSSARQWRVSPSLPCLRQLPQCCPRPP
jgi:O-antigen/teichoic acid export membrane protein